MITTPTAFSAPLSSQAGSSDLKAISGTPITSSVVAWPTPHHAPSRGRRGVAAVGGHERGDRHEVVGVGRVAQPEHERDAQRREQRRASKRPVSHASRSSTGWNRKSKPSALTAPALGAQSGHSPKIGKWVKRASKPMSSRISSRTRVELAPAPSRATCPHESQTRYSRTARPPACRGPGRGRGGSA